MSSKLKIKEPTASAKLLNSFDQRRGYHRGVPVRAVSPDKRFLASVVRSREESFSPNLIRLWDIPSGKYLGGVELLPDGGYVTSTPSGAFTASENAEPYLAVEIGKRRWPLADVPAFKKQFFRKDGINLLAPSP